MPEYLKPDVYVQRMANSAPPIEAVGTATAGMIGVFRRGTPNDPMFITGWEDFKRQTALGLDTPYIADSDTVYAVRQFFKNGGNRLFIDRIVGDGAVKASVDIGDTSAVMFEALSVGEWGNEVSVEVISNEDEITLFDIIIRVEGEQQETFRKLSDTAEDDNYYMTVINSETIGSDFVRVTDDTGTLTVTAETTLTSGDSDLTTLTDVDYTEALQDFNKIDDVNILAVPGQTAKAVQQGLLDYCENRGDVFAIVDSSSNLDPTGAKEEKNQLASPYGAYYYPWLKVLDPLSASGGKRLVPPSGFIAGIYARTDVDRGVHKTPAGLEARVMGAVEVETKLASGDIELLNPDNVNCIVPKKGQGIVVWGGRLISEHLDRKYVSDMRFDIMVEESCYEQTQWTIFEPNTPELWGRIKSALHGFLYGLWEEGALFGETPEEAYYIKCNEDLNPQEIRDAGKVIVEVGYAKVKPAEFTILRFAQKTNEQ